MKKITHKLILIEAALNGSLDGLEFDNKDDMIEKSTIIEMLKSLKMLLNEVQTEVKNNDNALAFAEYFHNNFDYYDCNSNGRIYKWIDISKRGLSAMTMGQIFDYWQSHNN